MIDFLKYNKIFFAISISLFLGSIALLSVYGLNYGIDFVPGSVLSVEFIEQRPSTEEVKPVLDEFGLISYSLRTVDDKGLEITFKDIISQELLVEEFTQRRTQIDESGEKIESEEVTSDKIKQEKIVELQNILNEKFEIDMQGSSYQEVSPIISKRITKSTMWALILSIIVIVFLVAYSFRKVSRPISSWRYGLAAIIALFHDVTIPLGVFALLGEFMAVQFTLPIVVALLTVFGYSVNDTIVTFDRVRENLMRKTAPTFKEIINKSLNEILGRSIATSVTTLLPLVAIYMMGSDSLKYFSLALIIGILLGTYSSMFLAGPLLYIWSKTKADKFIK